MTNVVSQIHAATPAPSLAVPAGAPTHETLLQRLTRTEEQVLTVMQAAGRDCLKLLSVVDKYLPAASCIAAAVFPGEAPAIASATNVINLIENAVVTVEAKWAAGNQAGKTGTQKLADVLTLVEAPAIELLAKAGIQANTAYITNLINVVVGILNVRPAAA